MTLDPIREFLSRVETHAITSLVAERLFGKGVPVRRSKDFEAPEEVLIEMLMLKDLSPEIRVAVIRGIHEVALNLIKSLSLGSESEPELCALTRICRILDLASPSESKLILKLLLQLAAEKYPRLASLLPGLTRALQSYDLEESDVPLLMALVRRRESATTAFISLAKAGAPDEVLADCMAFLRERNGSQGWAVNLELLQKIVAGQYGRIVALPENPKDLGGVSRFIWHDVVHVIPSGAFPHGVSREVGGGSGLLAAEENILGELRRGFKRQEELLGLIISEQRDRFGVMIQRSQRGESEASAWVEEPSTVLEANAFSGRA